MEEEINYPPSFGLGGRRWRMRNKVPFQAQQLVILALRSGSVANQVAEIPEFLANCVHKDDREEFRTFMQTVPEEDDESVFTMEDLFTAYQEASAGGARVPFRSPSDSSESPTTKNADSTSVEDSPSTVLTSPVESSLPTSA